MLSEREFEDYCRQVGLQGLAREYVERVRNSEPSRMVGTTSMAWHGVCRSSPRAAIPLGQWATSGVQAPPSCTQVLCIRKGVLQAVDQPAPRQR